MNVPCHIIMDLMNAYLYGTCSEETRGIVSAHLESCQSCAEAFCRLYDETAAWEEEMARLEKWGVLWMLWSRLKKLRDGTCGTLKRIQALLRRPKEQPESLHSGENVD